MPIHKHNMTAGELREKFIDFFVDRGHKQIPSSSLLPENDPTTLFISAGMHPLVPYLLGEPHPLGKRLCSVQKCLRTGDIESVGDTYHHTFFEMLGNWSLGDYWKEEMIPWSFEFLTKVLHIPAEKISVTCFAGDSDAPKDEETASLWEKVGIHRERIYFLGKEDNWWGPAGQTGPCGPDTEMFCDTGKEKCGLGCHPGCSCGKYIEIWNDVFMQYNKKIKDQKSKIKTEEEYEFLPLEQKNIDTGMGVERTLAVLNGLDDNYQTELFWPIIQKIEEISGKSYEEEKNKKPMRIIADHLRASVFVIAEGIIPAKTERGSVLRRLIVRSLESASSLQIKGSFIAGVAGVVIETLGNIYPEIEGKREQIFEELKTEEERFVKEKNDYLRSKYFKKGVISLAESAKKRTFQPTEFHIDELSIYKDQIGNFDYFFKANPFFTTTSGAAGTAAFEQKSTYGIPIEDTKITFNKYFKVVDDDFYSAVKKNQELHKNVSRKSVEKKFAGGLADNSEVVTKYHTATHLLHQALRDVLGDHVYQVGSNITAERFRFDFTHSEKLTEKQVEKVEEIVNQKIVENLPVKMEIMTLEEAKKTGALAFFEQKYGEQIKVYSIGSYSKEVCGGPHVNSTGQIGKIKIIKEESCGAGKRRIYAKLF